MQSLAGKSQLFSTKVARDVSFRAAAGKIATSKYESSTRSKLPGISQLLSTEVAREINFNSSGWKIATFNFESVSRIEETCSDQL